MTELDPNKIQLCRVGQHSAEAVRTGQACACPVGTCKLWKGGLRPADCTFCSDPLFAATKCPECGREVSTVIADNAPSLPENSQYMLCWEGDTNGVLICQSLTHMRNVLNDTYPEDPARVARMLNPVYWNDGQFGPPLHFEQTYHDDDFHNYEFHIWRVCDLES